MFSESKDDAEEDELQQEQYVSIGFDNLAGSVSGVNGDFVPAGSMIGIEIDPFSMGEVFTYKIFNTDRPTLYMTADRDKSKLRGEIEMAIDSDIGEDDMISEVSTDMGDIKREVSKFDEMHDDYNMVINPVTTFSNTFDVMSKVDRLADCGAGVVYLVFGVEKSDMKRREKRTMKSLDGVFRIESSGTHSNDIYDSLAVTKLRGSERPDEKIQLNIGRTVTPSNENRISG